MKITKIWEKIWISILTLTIIVSNMAIMNVEANGKQTEAFSGKRQIVYITDQSNLNNYIDGGRSAFDLILRKDAPEWLSYDISTKNRNIYVSFLFEFTSFEDYEVKLKELLTYDPNIVKKSTDELHLIEGHSALHYMNFLQSILNSLNESNDGIIENIFRVIENTIEVDGKEYKGNSDRLVIKPSEERLSKVDLLDIHTCFTERNTYRRSITVRTRGDSKKIVKYFELAGKVELVEMSDSTQISVTFESFNLEDMTQKTMECLNVPNSISEQQSYVDVEKVLVTYTEFIDLSELLEEEGTYLYTFECPEYYGNVSTDDENVYVGNQKITAENIPSVSYSYERGFQFDSIEINTDLSDIFGRKTRIITLTTPTNMGIHYHQKIKEWAQKQMTKGTILEIFDEKGTRYYQFCFSSWFWEEMTDFTQSILNGRCKMDVKRTWMPWGENSVQEKIKVGELVTDMVPSNEILVSYTLKKISKVNLGGLKNEMDTNVSDEKVLFKIENGEKISFSYREIDFIKCVIEFLVILLGVIVFVLIKRKLQRRKSTENICPNCGSTVEQSQGFCGKCGTRLK